MTHEIESMFSVIETPWHGLGNIILSAPTIEEAMQLSGASWTARLEKMYIDVVARDIAGQILPGVFNKMEVPDTFAVVRDDSNKVISTVGNRYEIYQNPVMWEFIKNFQLASGIVLETAGVLRQGKIVWVLAKKGSIEAVNGDIVEEYFLFRNSFDGSSPITILFTNIRVVCANTLTMAIKGASNMFHVRHTASASDQLKEVEKALGIRHKYQEKVNEIIASLVKTAVTVAEIDNILENVIFPEKDKKAKVVQVVGAGNNVVSLADFKDKENTRAATIRTNRIQAVKELVETGKGTDIAGVKGSLWGVYNALTEWSDWDKTVKTTGGRDLSESKFESAFFGSGSQFKADALNSLLRLAA